MKWMNPPEVIRRFTLHQIAQHWAAVFLGAILAVSAAASPFLQSGVAGDVHVHAGLAGAGFLLYHLLVVVGIGIRDDVPVEKVAFLPLSSPADGKYAPGERGDYFLILSWSLLLAVTGIVLRWPGRVGIPGPRAFYWLKVVHAGCGAAWIAHILAVHVPARWLRSPPSFRRAVIGGTVPLAEAVSREGWVADLVAAGILVPVPSETVSEDRRESLKVRDLLEEGNRLTRHGRYEDAAAAFEEAIRLYPEYSQARFNLGVARMRQGRMDLAAEQFRRFVETDPFNPMAEKARELLREAASDAGGGGESR